MNPDAWMVHSGEIWKAPTSPYSDERGEPLYSAATIRKWLEEEPSEAMQKALNDMAQCEGYMLEGIRAMLDTKLRELEGK